MVWSRAQQLFNSRQIVWCFHQLAPLFFNVPVSCHRSSPCWWDILHSLWHATTSPHAIQCISILYHNLFVIKKHKFLASSSYEHWKKKLGQILNFYIELEFLLQLPDDLPLENLLLESKELMSEFPPETMGKAIRDAHEERFITYISLLLTWLIRLLILCVL